MRRVVSLAGGLLLLAACGGGGGGVVTPVGVRYDGTYHAVYMYGRTVTTDRTVCMTGEATTTSATETYLGPVLLNEVGILSTADPFYRIDHLTSSGPDLTWQFSGSTALDGGISPDGELGGLATAQVAGIDSGAIFLVRSTSGRTTAEMAGNHHVVALTYAAGTRQVVLGTATLDALGAGSSTVLESNTDGTVGGPTPLIPITVAVSPDGSVGHTGSIDLEGGLRDDGRIAILGGGTTTGSDRRILVYLRKATVATTSTLLGSYTVVGLGHRTGTSLFESLRGTFVCDGAGTATSSLSYDTEGTQTPFFSPASTTYSVGTDGTLNARIDDRNVRGAVSDDGSVAVLASVVTAGTPPSLYLLIRR